MSEQRLFTLVVRQPGGLQWATPTMRLRSMLVDGAADAGWHAVTMLKRLGIDEEAATVHVTQWRQQFLGLPDRVTQLTRPDTGEVLMEYMCATVRLPACEGDTQEGITP